MLNESVEIQKYFGEDVLEYLSVLNQSKFARMPSIDTSSNGCGQFCKRSVTSNFSVGMGASLKLPLGMI